MTAVLDYGEIMSKKRLTEKKEQNARLVYSDLSLKQGFKKFLLNPMYIFPVLISTILCYAYYLTHETVQSTRFQVTDIITAYLLHRAGLQQQL